MQISRDGGQSWATLDTINSAYGSTKGTYTKDISAYATSGTQLRFVAAPGSGTLYVDNVEFDAQLTGYTATYTHKDGAALRCRLHRR